MSSSARADVKYYPSLCPFVRRPVWAIVVQQAGGAWKIANCLDKERACFEHECIFTTDGGQWPFDRLWLPGSPRSSSESTHGAP